MVTPGRPFNDAPNRFTTSRLPLWFAVGALAVIAVTVIMMTAYQRSTYTWVEHSRVVYQTTRSALIEIAAAQQRLADDPDLAARAAVDSAIHGSVGARLDSVVALTVDNPEQRRLALEVRAAAERWAAAAVDLGAPGSTSGSIVSTERRFGLPAAVSALAVAVDSTAKYLIGQESRLYDTRLARFRRAETATMVVTVAEVLFVALILISYASHLRRYLRTVRQQHVQLENQAEELQSQAAELELANIELEEAGQVSERARQAVEAEAQERARAFALLDASLDGAPIAIAVLDKEFRFVRVNKPWTRLDGGSVNDHLGKRITDLPFSPDAYPTAVPFLEGCLADATITSNVELSGFAASDSESRRFWLLSCAPVTVPNLGRIGVVVALLDVTDRTRLSEEFLHIQKMEAVGRLAGGIAHDFNNSLAVINAYASMIQISDELSDINLSRLSEITDAVDRAAVLTQQLLAFGRRQMTMPRPVDVNEAIRRMTPMLIRIIPASITLGTRLDATPSTVLVDPSQLEQVLMNLISNAIHAMPDGGSLTVATDSIELDSSYTAAHASVVAGRYVLLTLTDSGSGMDEQTMRRMFEPFFTTKEPGRGTGLGLASVYAIVRSAHGYVWPYSEVGKGTTFKIYLPQTAVAAASSPAPTGSAIVREFPLDEVTILLVEDDAKLRPAVARLLTQSEYRVLQAPSGEEALAILAKDPTGVDLVITDLVMPAMSGRELSERIVAEFPGIPILFTSGYTDDLVIRQGLVARGLPFVQKPFTRDQIIAAIEGALAAT